MTDAEPLVPDDKDWTWVLERVCAECGVDVRSFPVTEVGQRIRANAASFATELEEHAATAASRTRADRWSLLEYGCHVRDVYRLYLERLDLMLTEDGPQYPNWDQDITAVDDDYGSQDPQQVATELVSAAGALADRFDGVSGDQWRRTGYRSDGAAFTVESFARYLLHDPEHHLWDVRGN
jgi:hypothetical protein